MILHIQFFFRTSCFGLCSMQPFNCDFVANAGAMTLSNNWTWKLIGRKVNSPAEVWWWHSRASAAHFELFPFMVIIAVCRNTRKHFGLGSADPHDRRQAKCKPFEICSKTHAEQRLDCVKRVSNRENSITKRTMSCSHASVVHSFVGFCFKLYNRIEKAHATQKWIHKLRKKRNMKLLLVVECIVECFSPDGKWSGALLTGENSAIQHWAGNLYRYSFHFPIICKSFMSYYDFITVLREGNLYTAERPPNTGGKKSRRNSGVFFVANVLFKF